MVQQREKPLLHTKVQKPRVLPGTVARPQLWEVMDRAVLRPMLLVTAPAGYGKTTLVSSWLANRPADAGQQMPAAWLSLDARDSDLTVFTRYLCAALDGLFPDVCRDTLALLNGPVTPPLDEVVTAFSNVIESLNHDFILVLDDFHTLSRGAVSELLTALTRHWPAPLHLILIARHHPICRWPRCAPKGSSRN